MTDKEALMALLNRFNLEPVPNEDKKRPNEDYVILEAKKGNVEGYSGFVAVFEFDDDGTFVDLSLWE